MLPQAASADKDERGVSSYFSEDPFDFRPKRVAIALFHERVRKMGRGDESLLNGPWVGPTDQVQIAPRFVVGPGRPSAPERLLTDA